MYDNFKIKKDKNGLISEATYMNKNEIISMSVEEKEAFLKISFLENRKAFLVLEYNFQHCKVDSKKLESLEVNTTIVTSTSELSKNRKFLLNDLNQKCSNDEEKLPNQIEKKIEPFMQTLKKEESFLRASLAKELKESVNIQIDYLLTPNLEEIPFSLKGTMCRLACDSTTVNLILTCHLNPVFRPTFWTCLRVGRTYHSWCYSKCPA